MRRADKLTTCLCRLPWNLELSTSRNPQGLSRSVSGLLMQCDIHNVHQLCQQQIHTEIKMNSRDWEGRESPQATYVQNIQSCRKIECLVILNAAKNTLLWTSHSVSNKCPNIYINFWAIGSTDILQIGCELFKHETAKFSLSSSKVGLKRNLIF